MARFPGPQEATFWFDFEELTPDNLWRDKSKNGLHATPQAAYAAPNYGLDKIGRKGSCYFPGALNGYATLPMRYYDVAPTSDLSVVCVGGGIAFVGNYQLIFSAYWTAGGNNWGHTFGLTDANRPYMAGMYGTPAAAVFTDATGVTAGSPKISTWIMTSSVASRETVDRVPQNPVWAGGVANQFVYNPAVAPRIGLQTTNFFPLLGRLYFLALFPFPFTDAEAKAMTDWLRNQV